MLELYHWRCSCGARSYKRPLTLAHAKKEARRHRSRANATDESVGRMLRPHEVAIIPWQPTYLKPYRPKIPRTTCWACGRPDVRLTTRGTLWQHRPNPLMAEYCYGGGPRAPHPPKKKGPRPDLVPDPRIFATELLMRLIAQDLRREGKHPTTRAVLARLHREKSKSRRVSSSTTLR